MDALIQVSIIVPLPLHIVSGATDYFDTLMQQHLSIVDSIVTNTTDISNTATVIELLKK